MSNIQLRPYQQNLIKAVKEEFLHGNKRVVAVAPCGAGKTYTTGWMIKQACERGKRSIFFVHRQELIEQTAKAFLDLDIPFGIIRAGIPMKLNLPVQIASVQTLAKRLDSFQDSVPKPDFLICDECHHILANTYQKILDKFPEAFLLGVTATPLRMGGITLHDSFDSMVQSVSVNELIKRGNLTTFKYFADNTAIDLSKVKIEHGDYSSKQLSKIMVDQRITGSIVKHYLELAENKSAICYCVDVEHSKFVADAFQKAGIHAAHCDGETPKDLRASIVNDFRNGNIKVLCNAELFGEGFDVPHCQAVILARPTQSLTLFIQQALRPLRPDPNDPNKVAVIIDHVQNYSIHGLPNINHQWSLLPNIKKRITCPNCGKTIIPTINPTTKRKSCPHCGFIFPKNESQEHNGREKEIRNGELSEIPIDYSTDDNDTDISITQKPCNIEQLFTIAQEKKYKKGWVAFRALELAKSYDDCLQIANFCGYKQGWAWYQWNELKTQRA